MKKALGILVMVMVVSAVIMTAACSKSGGKGIVGNWAMVGSPEKIVKITKEGEQFFYEGSQGKSAAQKQDENTLLVPMGPIQVTAKYDPAKDTLSVSFMGENYQYTRAK